MSPQRPGYDRISDFGLLLSQNYPSTIPKISPGRQEGEGRKVLAGRQEGVGRQEDKQVGMKAGNKAGRF